MIQFLRWTGQAALGALLAALPILNTNAQTIAPIPDRVYEHADTRELVALVNDAAALVAAGGEATFRELRVPDSRWRQGERYIFVLDPRGNMLVHADPAMEGKNQLALKDINGKPIVRGLIGAATTMPDRSDGWYHYEWPVPGGLLPRWKSTYVRQVTAPSGERYIVGSGVYNDRMERAFVVEVVEEAVARIERDGTATFPLLHDPTGPFIVKDAYVFVIDTDGVDLVNPGFPNLEGRSLLDLKDTQGKPLIREMLGVAQTRGAGWVDYMWPRPGENVSTRKSAYVKKARHGDTWLLVGSGVYLEDAPSAARPMTKTTASELMTLVREGAALLEAQGENAYPQLRQKGSKWFHDETYFFVWLDDGTLQFHAADPGIEGRNDLDIKDVHGRPFGRMILEAAHTPAGEGWVHYMYPQPGDIFPTWKSTFVKRVTFPGGTNHIVGCGIFNMQMDRAFIEDVVDRAAALVKAKGTAAFPALRDRTGPFVFLDTYVFVDTTDGVELVNPAQPSLEGMNLSGLKDPKGKIVVDAYIEAALKEGSAWVEYHWYRPGSNTVARKEAYVRKVEADGVTYIVGSGLYVDWDES